MTKCTLSLLGVTLRTTLLTLVACCQTFTQARYDVVIRGGRVVDPETSLDAVRDVGIGGNQIAAVSDRPLSGARVIEAAGLVVAPGFIDLTQHDQTAAGYRLKAMDGVSTALELEIGPPDVRKFLDQRRNAALINYGTTASHPWARAAIFGQAAVGEEEIVPPSGPTTNDPATPEQMQRMQQRLRAELNAGGLGVGMGIGGRYWDRTSGPCRVKRRLVAYRSAICAYASRVTNCNRHLLSCDVTRYRGITQRHDPTVPGLSRSVPLQPPTLSQRLDEFRGASLRLNAPLGCTTPLSARRRRQAVVLRSTSGSHPRPGTPRSTRCRPADRSDPAGFVRRCRFQNRSR